MVLAVKNVPANGGDAGDASLIPESGEFSGGEHGNPLQYSRQRNLAGYSLWSRKESDMIEKTQHACTQNKCIFSSC